MASCTVARRDEYSRIARRNQRRSTEPLEDFRRRNRRSAALGSRERPLADNPCRCCRVVCARDFTHDPAGGFDAHAFADWLRERVIAGEARVRYVISNRRIFSGRGQTHPAGLWRTYSGSNPHTKHVHVSVRHGAAQYDDGKPWGWHPRDGTATTTTPTTTGS